MCNVFIFKRTQTSFTLLYRSLMPPLVFPFVTLLHHFGLNIRFPLGRTLHFIWSFRSCWRLSYQQKVVDNYRKFLYYLIKGRGYRFSTTRGYRFSVWEGVPFQRG
jgi:hypothetical protein